MTEASAAVIVPQGSNSAKTTATTRGEDQSNGALDPRLRTDNRKCACAPCLVQGAHGR
jgi:hypothetical protein